MQPCRRRFKGEREKCPFQDYLALVTGEKERSERHNRFFALFGMAATSVAGLEMYDLIEAQLRATDYVFKVNDRQDHMPVLPLRYGALLPETDLKGAMVVKERLSQLFAAQMIPVQMGMAIYPDDATIPEVLLEMAFQSTFQGGRLQVMN